MNIMRLFCCVAVAGSTKTIRRRSYVYSCEEAQNNMAPPPDDASLSDLIGAPLNRAPFSVCYRKTFMSGSMLSPVV